MLPSRKKSHQKSMDGWKAKFLWRLFGIIKMNIKEMPTQNIKKVNRQIRLLGNVSLYLSGERLWRSWTKFHPQHRLSAYATCVYIDCIKSVRQRIRCEESFMLVILPDLNPADCSEMIREDNAGEMKHIQFRNLLVLFLVRQDM